MNINEIKINNGSLKYSILIGDNILNALPKRIRLLCPNAKKIGIVLDKKIPKKFKSKISKLLKNYELSIFEYNSNEKLKSFKNVNLLLEKCLAKRFNRSDVLIAVGGGVIGDFTGFAASLLKRGINFINIPSTLLAQVDSSIGGKTGVNSKFGKNLIGSFYQPKLVISDISLLKSLGKREIICGYAEILKHSIISSLSFFNWLKKNSKELLEKQSKHFLKIAIFRSCKIKLSFVNKDVREQNLRMILNFGHTFAHAIEAKNKFSKKINHGEAVLMGMMMATKLSKVKRIISEKTLSDMINIYKNNNLNIRISRFFKKSEYLKIVDYMVNDKKNNSKKINLILLRKIGKTTTPGKFKMSVKELKNSFSRII